MTDNLSIWAKKLVENDHFIDTIDKQIKQIMKDGHIDSSDIPEVILLLTETYNNIGNVKIEYDELQDVIKEVVNYILNKYNLIPEDQIEQFTKIINMVIKLVIIKPNVKKGCLKYFKFCK
jgi:division protein CdvB (Snf7/Vps24/ESCRT-III family)